MKKEDNYYGIRFNDDIPIKDELNKYNKEVELKFMGHAYLIKRTEEKVEKIELENYYKFKKEGLYVIEFTNNLQETYTLQLKIEKSYWFLIILFILGIIFFSMLLPNNRNILYKTFLDVIDLSVIKVDIEDPHRYIFDVEFENLVSSDINLPSTMNAKTVSKSKIAPGVNGEFSIIISTMNSTVDMKYSVKFEDITNEKPVNLKFKIKGTNSEFSTLQELEQYLKGNIEKQTEKEIVIEWQWAYEIDDTQDTIDTKDGRNLSNYKFRINVNGEEAIK